MNDAKKDPCADGLTPACFEENPEWARMAFAYRLLYALTPAQISRRLPRILRLPLLAPGLFLPPGIELPPGTIVPPGSIFPPGWTPGDQWPPGVQPPPTLPAYIPGTGAIPPNYTGLDIGGPPTRPAPGAAVVEVTLAVTGETTDGVVYAYDNDWETNRTESTGNQAVTNWTANSDAVKTEVFLGSYTIYRTFLYFDLTGIEAGKTIVSCTLQMMAYSKADSDVCVLQGTQGKVLATTDYDAFTGTPFASADWALGSGDADLANVLTFNAAGLIYIASVFGDEALLCLREYTHDYLGASPGDVTAAFKNGFYFADDVTAGNKPTLTIVYEE